MPTMYEQVIEFNEKILKIEPLDLGPMSDKMAEHLKKSLDEEAYEFEEGHKHGVFWIWWSLQDGSYARTS
jgi:hypothetical protein